MNTNSEMSSNKSAIPNENILAQVKFIVRQMNGIIRGVIESQP